jgi:hypothetical protein
MMPAKEAHMAKHTTLVPEDTQQTTKSTVELQERIRSRAYELYEQRGGNHGNDLDDWLQAEWELTQPKPEKVAA